MAGHFPILFSMALDKEASVADYLVMVGEHIFWDICFRRSFHDWELSAFMELLNLLYGVSLVGMGEDEVRWVGARNAGFSVSSFYHLLAAERDGHFPW